jgi:C-terminal domain 6 of the ABC-three component (ABC-3C) systems
MRQLKSGKLSRQLRPNYAVQITALPDERLEAFVSDWLARRTRDYFAHERWSGAGDMGRDVVGYVTSQRHEGEWHNFQCKQLLARLSETAAFVELGKIFMHAANGDYTLPGAYYFVSPRGVVRNVQAFIAHPERFRQAFVDRWDTVVAPRLVDNATVPLSHGIRAAIAAFDFTRVYSFDAVRLVEDPFAKPVLVHWFNDDPGPAPVGVPPADLQREEAVYVEQLVDLYAQRSGETFSGPHAVLQHEDWGPHLRNQRTRFFEAAEFDRYYRDSTPADYLVTFKEELYHGVADIFADNHKDGLERVTKVLAQAASVLPSGVLGRHARVQVKQGTCHHFANEGRWAWKR